MIPRCENHDVVIQIRLEPLPKPHGHLVERFVVRQNVVGANDVVLRPTLPEPRYPFSRTATSVTPNSFAR